MGDLFYKVKVAAGRSQGRWAGGRFWTAAGIETALTELEIKILLLDPVITVVGLDPAASDIVAKVRPKPTKPLAPPAKESTETDPKLLAMVTTLSQHDRQLDETGGRVVELENELKVAVQHVKDLEEQAEHFDGLLKSLAERLTAAEGKLAEWKTDPSSTATEIVTPSKAKGK